MRGFFGSFAFALAGLGYTIKTERNMRVHLCFAFYVVLAGFITGLGAVQWAVVALCIGAVTGAECVNTALERLCDAAHPERCEGIKAAKDASAAAVLCLALAAAAAGCSIFFRQERIDATLAFAERYPVWAGVILISVLPLGLWAFHKRSDKEKK